MYACLPFTKILLRYSLPPIRIFQTDGMNRLITVAKQIRIPIQAKGTIILDKSNIPVFEPNNNL